MQPLLEVIDYDAIFQGLVDAIMASSMGAMVSMVGGPELLQSIKGSFKEKMQNVLNEVTQAPAFREALAQQTTALHPEKVQAKVEHIVTQRLSELTPDMVKLIVQQMIQRHLGWLVVWGGVFGGLIGLTVSLVL